MHYVYLLTGGNIGDRQEHLATAARLLEERCGTIIDRSDIYETAPWGKTDQDNFLNQALVLETAASPKTILHTLLDIEEQMGRKRMEKNGPRIIDIDILLYDHQVIREAGLSVPHPELANRRFVLAPLSQVAAAYIHPVLRKTIQQLLAECQDTLPVKKITQ